METDRLGQIEELVKSYLISGGRASELHDTITKLNKNMGRVDYLQEELRKKSQEYSRVINAIHQLRIRAKELEADIKRLKFEIRNLKLLKNASA